MARLSRGMDNRCHGRARNCCGCPSMRLGPMLLTGEAELYCCANFAEL